MGSFFGFLMIANQWLTNCRLDDTNDLLEEIRRQGITPAERKAEDAAWARNYTIRAAITLALLIILFSAYFICSALETAGVERVLNAAHLQQP